ncbi:D-alanyl-D-alanine carboxypeptidase family protein [Pleionea litopenaei]|uniref:serine-type D-Ala-D-Ala carboxypeptidase n=1 Tax=Pleionea litopenaei TaxID=3070815 RepID=A0AA51RS48_9GAMM|nr:D-alanyl-D-alanine carboxypeptidase family protein [Pleionea sp. HL-JVS1]WMS86567.1 D-alanyl-D-alanine carboxypeptidase family protein [Pleionea sp. HL-JVS1]
MTRFAAFLLILSLTITARVVAITPAPPALGADGYILMDYQSGHVIAENNADNPLPPASLTKMMTSYVVSAELAAGNIQLTDMVTVSENAWAKNFPESSKMFIEVNKQVSVEDLLKGLIISSGGDASVALAEHIAGSEDAFAQLMNMHAQKLGMTNTHFVNAHGLTADGHQTTARDMAILARALIKDYPQEYELYKLKEFTYNNIRQYNRNSLLWDRSLEVDGVKTGHTEAAGYCLVSSAVKDGMRLIAVVMGTSSEDARKIESKKLLTYGFRFFETVSPLTANSQVHQARVWGGEVEQATLGVLEQTYLTIPRGKRQQLKANYVVENELEAPLAKGQVVGQIFFELEGEEVAKVPMVALEDVAEGGWFSRMIDAISRWFSELFS